MGGLGGKKVTKEDFEKMEKSAEEQDQMKQRLSVSSAASDGSSLSKSAEPRYFFNFKNEMMKTYSIQCIPKDEEFRRL